MRRGDEKSRTRVFVCHKTHVCDAPTQTGWVKKERISGFFHTTFSFPKCPNAATCTPTAAPFHHITTPPAGQEKVSILSRFSMVQKGVKIESCSAGFFACGGSRSDKFHSAAVRSMRSAFLRHRKCSAISYDAKKSGLLSPDTLLSRSDIHFPMSRRYALKFFWIFANARPSHPGNAYVCAVSCVNPCFFAYVRIASAS